MNYERQANLLYAYQFGEEVANNPEKAEELTKEYESMFSGDSEAKLNFQTGFDRAIQKRTKKLAA